MNIQVTATPHMLYETVELLFAYVNHFPLENLTGEGMFALPKPAVQEIMDAVCSGISENDPDMVYYFGAYTLPESARRQTCIARHLAYNHMFISGGAVAADCDSLRDFFRQHGLTKAIEYLEDFCAIYEGEDEKTGTSLLDSIKRLDLSPQYTQKLLEQFSDYERAVSRLQAIVAPVAEKLEPMLKPWADRAESLAQSWRDGLSSPEAVKRLMDRCCFRNHEQIDNILIQLCYLRPNQAPGQVSDFGAPHIYLHMGVCIRVDGYNPDRFLSWEFEAMRLLGSPVRLRMLHALWDNPMSSRELAKALKLNLGTLCRDISSLCEYRLLILETVKDRRRYRTNRETMAYLAGHLAQFGDLQLPDK